MSQDLICTLRAEDFNKFTAELNRINERSAKANRDSKKRLYERVLRAPVSSCKDTVTIRLVIKNRAKVLLQEVTALVDKYRFGKPAEPVNGDLDLAKGTVVVAGKTVQIPAKPVPSPVQAKTPSQWGVWVPCRNEAVARLLVDAGFRLGDAGTPTVECRG